MSKHKKQAKGAPVAPFNPIPGLDTVETQVTAEIVDETVPAIPKATDTFRTLVRSAMAELVKAEGVDYLNAAKTITEDDWFKWAEETVPEVRNVKVLTIRMEGRMIGEQARIRASRADQRGGNQAENKAEPKTAAEKMQDTKLKAIAENADLFEAYCVKQATLSKPVSVAGAANAIRLAKDKAAGKVSTTESVNVRRERLNEDALAELATRETSFSSIPEVVAFAKERLTMILRAKDTVSDEEISVAVKQGIDMRQRRRDQAKEADMAAKLAAAQQAKAAKTKAA